MKQVAFVIEIQILVDLNSMGSHTANHRHLVHTPTCCNLSSSVLVKCKSLRAASSSSSVSCTRSVNSSRSCKTYS